MEDDVQEEMHSAADCPMRKRFEELEGNFDALNQNLQLSAMYGKELLQNNENLKGQVKELQVEQEVIFFVSVITSKKNCSFMLLSLNVESGPGDSSFEDAVGGFKEIRIQPAPGN